MKSLNISIVVFIVEILFLKVNEWTNGIQALSMTKPDFHTQLKANDGAECTELISIREQQHVPYVETYKARMWGPFYKTKTRVNYRTEYRTVWSLQPRCCNGYRLSGKLCIPRCTEACGAKATCAKPDICVCNKGYQMSTDVNGKRSCVPVCTNGCINGTCIEPGICSCDQGYWLGSDGFTCTPVCHEECERNHGFCSEPNVCSCHNGYRKTNNYTAYNCEPICERECTNGYCVAPDVCKCYDGYVLDDYDLHFTCKPYCSEICILGECTAPEICTCYGGYKSINATVCEPICSETCQMGTCVAPESCGCNNGYGLLDKSRYICEPICELNCGNGTCTAPEVCLCDEGFIHDESGIDQACKPHCKIPCGLYGECTSPDNCTCSQGYRAIVPNELNSSSINNQTFLGNSTTGEFYSICQPICNPNCINGKCTAPDVCTCAEGYRSLNPESHQLTLGDGYSLSSSTPLPDIHRTYICEPICTVPCDDNEICTAPDVCTCKNGYAKTTNGSCVPVCTHECHNGTCTASDHCTCNDGYMTFNETVCEPICTDGCQNGDCIGPDQCVCHENFIPSTVNRSMIECISVCTRNCSGHGVCMSDEYDCECHYGWTGWNCEQPALCVVTMDFNHTDSHSITIRNQTNATIQQIYEDSPNCYQCDSSLNNESLCYYMTYSEEANTTSTVVCLISTDSPCYITPSYNVSSNLSEVTWSLMIVAILMIISATATVYIVYRKHQRKKVTTTDNATNNFLRESFATESLLSENVIYL